MTNTVHRFLKSGELSDFEIHCGSKTFGVHKVIISAQSRVLYAACTNGFQESVSSVVELPEDNPWAVELMIMFLYSGTYSIEGGLFHKNLELHVKVHVLADKYDIPRLSDFAIVAYQAELRDATRRGNRFVKAFFRTIPMIYTETPESNVGLRKVAVKLARIMRPILIETETEFSKEFQNLLHEVPGFAAGMANDYFARPLLKRCGKCNAQTAVGAVTGAVCNQCEEAYEGFDLTFCC